MKFRVLLMSAIVLACASSLLAKSSLVYIWSADIKGAREGQKVTTALPSRDLNADGKKEKLVITTVVGGSQNSNSLVISWENGKRSLKVGFSSAGGCAIGTIRPGKKSQIAVWDFIWAKKQAHGAPHTYTVDLYDWKGASLSLVDTYQTRKKYDFFETTKEPLLEYRQSRAPAPQSVASKRVVLPAPDLSIIKTKMKKTSVFIFGPISKVYRLDDWALLTDKAPGREWGIDIWRKENTGWRYVAGDFFVPGDEDFPRRHNIPLDVWKALTKGL